jgi:filamentous hemagglutinin family protein
MGSQVHLTDPHFTIGENLGQRVGNNLFHSFEHFNVPTEGSATFTGSLGIQNVLARVTGPTSSNIDGTLRSTISGANLYLMNPNGILFGPNARLDLSGSFHATTADSIRLGKDGQFNAREPSKSLLTVAPPAAFGFLSEHPAAIEVQGSLLQVPKGQTLSIIGGDLQITQGNLYAPAGQINIASVASPGEVIPSLSDLSLNKFGKLGKITLSLPSLESRTTKLENLPPPFDKVLDPKLPLANIDVSEQNSGQIFIRAGHLFLNQGYIYANNYAGKQAGNIDIVVAGDMSLSNASQIAATNMASQPASEQSHIVIKAGNSLSLNNPKGEVFYDDEAISKNAAKFNKILTNAFGVGKAGNIEIDTPKLTVSLGTIQSATAGSANAGDIKVNSQQVTLHHNGFINAATASSGQGGTININATEAISVSNFSSISVAVGKQATGNSGKIELTTKQLSLEEVGAVLGQSQGEGNAGDIVVKANSIRITTETPFLPKKRSNISTASVKSGGGNIDIRVTDRLYIANGLITAQAQGDKEGDKGGDLTISHPHLFIMDQYSKLSAQAKAGHGGNILIEADNFINPIPENVTATSEKSIDGEVTINAFQPNLAGLLTTRLRNYLRLGLLKPPRWCGRQNRYKAPTNSFAIRLQDMLEPSPSDLRFFSPVWWEE